MTRTLDLLERLIAFPTVSHTSNLSLIDWAQSLLQHAGFVVTRIPSSNGEKAGLHARIGPDVTGGICLSGHTDVVPTDGQDWTQEPFELTHSDTHVYGRGTTDMKGFVASALALAERATHAHLIEPLSIVLSYDEEIGCVGIREMLPKLIPLLGQPEWIIVGEPTSMQVATGHKGKAALKVTCTGEAGHSALAPNFVNAIHVASAFVADIRALQSQLAKGPHDRAYDIPYSTVHIGKISGGQALNIVPDLVCIDMEFRHLAEVPAQELQDVIEDAACRVADDFGARNLIQVDQVNAYPGLNQAMRDEDLATAQILAGNTASTKVAFGTEAGYFAQLGHQTVVIGPGDMASDGHKPDEALEIAQLAACDAMMDRILRKLTQA